MENKPKVSVIMSVFNGQKFLNESIQSILGQTFEDFELIIIDDGSTDRSLEIAKSFQRKDKRIIIISHSNKGLAKSLNIGIKSSQGDYIARMDADDISYKDRLMKQYKFMENNQSLDLIGCSIDVIDECGKIQSEKKQYTTAEKIFKTKYFQSPILHITFFGKKSFFEKHKGYRENLLYAQDYDLVLRAIDSGAKILNISEKLVQYRDFKEKVKPLKFIQQFRLTELIVKLSKERQKFGKEISDCNKEVERSLHVSSYNLFTTKYFLKTYFLNGSIFSKIAKKISLVIFMLLNSDLRRLIIRDFLGHKLFAKS
jgi:glycosyltransferase involved in cell wall biosynthesis